MSKTWTKYTYIALRPKGSLKFPNDLVVLTAWFQVSQSPLLSSPPMAAADPVQSTDKSAKKCSSSQVSRFGIEITVSVTAPENHQLNKSPDHSLLNFHIINSLFSGHTAASSLLPSYGCSRPCQASRHVCKETQQLEGEQIS